MNRVFRAARPHLVAHAALGLIVAAFLAILILILVPRDLLIPLHGETLSQFQN